MHPLNYTGYIKKKICPKIGGMASARRCVTLQHFSATAVPVGIVSFSLKLNGTSGVPSLKGDWPGLPHEERNKEGCGALFVNHRNPSGNSDTKGRKGLAKISL